MSLVTKISKTLSPVVPQAFRPMQAVSARLYTSKATHGTSTSADKPDDKKFNTEVTKEEFEANIKEYDEFVSGKENSKTFVESHYKGFQSLKDKGERTAEEQDRPEDFM